MDNLQFYAYSMYGNEFLLCSTIYEKLAASLRDKTLNTYFDIVYHFGQKEFRVKELAWYLGVTPARASQIISQLTGIDCVRHNVNGTYFFRDLLSFSY